MGKKSKIKLETGTIYQKEENGTYYYRYQVKGERKCVSLKTANQEEALKEAKKYLPIVQATTEEVISAHVKVARNLIKQSKKLKLADAFAVYEKHPDRATPATRNEEISYERSFAEFVDGPFIEGQKDITLSFRGSRNQRIIDMPVTRHVEEHDAECHCR